jgi:hypothetical protein
LAGPWTISREREDADGGTKLPAAISQPGTRPRRALAIRLPGMRPVRPVRPVIPFLPVLPTTVLSPPVPAQPAGQPPPASLGPPAKPAAASRGERRIRTGWALTLLAIMTAAAVLLAWATISIAERGVAASHAAGKRSAGPLVIPAPKSAGGLPMRFGSTAAPGSAAIVTELRHRFGAVGYRLVADARKAAETGGNARAATKITAAWTSGLYGQPGHLDPATNKPAWVMYLGLDATAQVGAPADSVGRLMLGLLGPYAKIGPWRVSAGHRGGAANCTVAWLGQTMVGVCGWATNHTIGALASPLRDTSVAELATLMISMRYDLQRK